MGWFLSFYILHCLKFLPSFPLIFQGQEETRDTRAMNATLGNYASRITSALCQGKDRMVDELLCLFIHLFYIKM